MRASRTVDADAYFRQRQAHLGTLARASPSGTVTLEMVQQADRASEKRGRARSARRAGPVVGVPYPVTQAAAIQRHLASVAKLQKAVLAAVSDWDAHDTDGMKSYVDYFSALADTLSDVLADAPVALPASCPCGGNEACAHCRGRGRVASSTSEAASLASGSPGTIVRAKDGG